MLINLEKMKKGAENGVPDLVYKFKEMAKLYTCDEVIDIGTPEDYKEYINASV